MWPPFPDAQQVMQDLLAPYGHTAKHLPDDWEHIVADGVCVIVVERVGGTDDSITDRPWVLVGVWGPDRPTAAACAAECTQAVLAIRDGGMAGEVWVDATSTRVGGLQPPGLTPDERRVITQYQLEYRRPFNP